MICYVGPLSANECSPSKRQTVISLVVFLMSDNEVSVVFSCPRVSSSLNRMPVPVEILEEFILLYLHGLLCPDPQSMREQTGQGHIISW